MKSDLSVLCAGILFAATFASCTEDGQPDAMQPEDRVQMEFYAGTDAVTRTQLVENNQVEWVADDAISLFDPSGANNCFTTDGAGSSVIFTGTAVEGDGNYYALYPYNAEAEWSEEHFTTVLPAVQTAQKGSFADGLNPSVAVADAQRNLSFTNVCALVKFTIGGENAALVEKVVFSGNGSEALAGTLTIDVSAESPAAIADADFGETEVALTGPFETDGVYYLVVAPAVLAKGLTLTFYNEDGHVWKKSGAGTVTLTAGHILNLGTVSPGSFAPLEGMEELDGVYHIYNADGLMSWALKTDVLTKDVVLENDIDMTGKAWIPVGTGINAGYPGDFDGNGKFINNLTVTGSGNAGLFGGLAQGARVHDVKFSGATVTGGSTSSSYVGVVAGASLGVIEDCNVRSSVVSGYNAGAVTGNNSTQVNRCTARDVQVRGTYAAGGIAAASYGKVEYCTLSGQSEVKAEGSGSRAGGIVGTSTQEGGVPTSGRLLKCAVDGAHISAVWAGGIAGENSFGIVAQCVANDVEVTSGTSSSNNICLGGVVGYNTRGDVVASYAAYSGIGSQSLSTGSLGGIVGYNYNSNAYVYGCYATHVVLEGTTGNKGSIAGYTNGHVVSCYAVLPEDMEVIGLVGSGSGTPDHCVSSGSSDYQVLTTGVESLTAGDNSVWEADKIWNLTASGTPTIVPTYISDPSGN